MQRAPVNQNNQNLMMSMIEKLTSSDLGQRAAIVHQILEDIAREELEEGQITALGLQDIRVGRSIQIGGSKKFIESEENSNGIDHEVVVNFFKEPLKPRLSKMKKQRKLSKEKLSVKNSREKEKSEKSHSKVSNNSQGKKRKVSSGKNKSFNSSHQGQV